MSQGIHVAVGVLIDDTGCVLLARRQKGTHLQGYWEFPGGKVEAGESVESALARELSEELGVSIDQTLPFMTVNHDYVEKQVLLDVHRCPGPVSHMAQKVSQSHGSRNRCWTTTEFLRLMPKS